MTRDELRRWLVGFRRNLSAKLHKSPVKIKKRSDLYMFASIPVGGFNRFIQTVDRGSQMSRIKLHEDQVLGIKLRLIALLSYECWREASIIRLQTCRLFSAYRSYLGARPPMENPVRWENLESAGLPNRALFDGCTLCSSCL
jgi:hypothetical protein